MLTTLMLALALSASPTLDDRLVGTWLSGRSPFITLSANGVGRTDDGKLKWTADGRQLTIVDEEGGTEQATYQVNDDTLSITMSGLALVLTRAHAGEQVTKPGVLGAQAQRANASATDVDAEQEALAQAAQWLAQNGHAATPNASATTARAAPPQTSARAAANDPLSRLLLSSAWCSSHYNTVSGASSSTRYEYHADGTWRLGARSETYSSGANGTVAGQYDSGNSGNWESRDGTLYMSSTQLPMQAVPGFQVSQNSNGYPIINSGGKEFYSCN
jgi:hypothetical protein